MNWNEGANCISRPCQYSVEHLLEIIENGVGANAIHGALNKKFDLCWIIFIELERWISVILLGGAVN